MKIYPDITRRNLLKSGFLILSLPLLFSAKQISAKQISNSFDSATSFNMKYLIKGLRDTKNVICMQEADRLERINYKNNNYYYLHLRNAGIDLYNAQLIATSLRKTHQNNKLFLDSFSISYNTSLSNKGLKVILESLPGHIKELGFVGCRFDDNAGDLIISFLTRCKDLTIVCVEDNAFSNSMKRKIKNALVHLPYSSLVI
ncbi:MAG: hypothetical protein ACKVIC_06715 [Gammaproteobacteria bacterium]|jgi:Ran GTPase-activating protein (RanGAP) involved in mRNA processing and transport